MTAFADLDQQQPTFFTFFLWKLSRADKKRRAKASTRTLLQTLVTLTLQLAGFASLTIAGFAWHIVAGFVVLGISCFVLSWLLQSPAPESQFDNGQYR